MTSQHILHDCMASECKLQAACLIHPRTIVQRYLDHIIYMQCHVTIP